MFKIKLLPLCAIFTFLFPNLVFAFDFDKNNLLADSELKSCNLKTESQVQRFLKDQGSCLADYTVDDDPAAKIIAGAYQEYGVSTCWLLTTLQKEQSLITRSSARSERALDFAMGFACPTGGNCDVRYKGFKKQVESAAWQIRNRYLENPESYTFQKGKQSKTEDGEMVRPKNNATAVNYIYTPVVGDGVNYGGNYNFVLYWNKWRNWFFLSHPSGSLLRADGGKAIYFTVYNSEEDRVEKMMVTNLNVFKARGYSMSQVISVDQGEVDGYPNSQIRMSYPNGTLVKGIGPAIYVIENNRRRNIASPKALKDLGYSAAQAKKISDSELTSISGGAAIVSGSRKIDGTLIRTKFNSAVYILDYGHKRHIADLSVFKANNYSWNNVKIISDAEMNSYPSGDSMILDDGILVKAQGKPTIYISENGLLRAIKSNEAFKSLGYKSSWVETVSAKFIDSSLKGESLE